MNDLVDISPDHLKVVQEILRENLPSGVAVWVFGSRASWATSDSSDLDLALEGDIDHDTILALEMAFEESSLPYTVDIIDLNQVSDSFRRIVEIQRVPLVDRYSSDNVSVDQGWIPVSDTATIVIGGTPSRSVEKYWHGKIPWATAKDVASVSGRYLYSPQEFITTLGLESSAAKLMPKGTIVITARGTVGAIAQLGQDMTFNQTCYALIPRNGVCQDFLFYALKGTLHRMRALTYGTIFDTITRKTFDSWHIPLPHLSEQQDIAQILGTLDDKIELNRHMNQTLEGITRALFKSWFVDFDPVRAKMDGTWKQGESLPGLPAHLYDLFPNELVDSELDEIPKGWEVSVIGNIARILGGTTPSTKVNAYWKDGVHYWATPKDLSILDSPVLLNTKRKITDAGLKQISSGLLPSGIVLLSSRAPIGYMAITEIPVAINQGFIAILPHLDISNIFVYHWCQYFLDEIKNYANGSTFLEINKNNFRKIPIIVPDIYIMNIFHKLTLVLHNRIVENECSSCNLSEQRNILLPRLISGLLRVSQSDCNKSGLK